MVSVGVLLRINVSSIRKAIRHVWRREGVSWFGLIVELSRWLRWRAWRLRFRAIKRWINRLKGNGIARDEIVVGRILSDRFRPYFVHISNGLARSRSKLAISTVYPLSSQRVIGLAFFQSLALRASGFRCIVACS